MDLVHGCGQFDSKNRHLQTKPGLLAIWRAADIADWGQPRGQSLSNSRLNGASGPAQEHLDLLKSVGGNYVRNTMSSRDEGNVWPFKKVIAGYDLEQWNDEYWHRFETFLQLTQARDIIVQIEIWATFDYYRENWAVNPFNPKNNINYTPEQTGLPEHVKTHPTRTENNFFWSIPAERNQRTTLR